MLQGKLKNILYKLIFPKQNKNYKTKSKLDTK
jgi:hypothetical protein